MSERSLEEEIKIKAQQNRKLARYMSSTQELVEEQIRKARERGDFDNLAGAGKPVDLSENPYEPSDMRMPLKILKDNDFTPFWIQLGKDIDADMDRLWQEVGIFERYSIQFAAEKHVALTINKYEKKKAVFYMEKRRDCENIKKKILNYNLHCPTFRLGRANIDVDDEMYKIITVIEKAIEEAQRS